MASKDRYLERRTTQKTLNKDPRITGHCPLVELPLDIMIVILEYLKSQPIAPVALISLGLTCRSLHRLIYSGEIPRSPRLTAGICLLLEKDLPESYHCRVCQKLHKWGSETIHMLRPCHLKSPCMVDGSPGVYRLTYLQARQVMNRAMYGPAYGLPLQSIEGDFQGDVCYMPGGIEYNQKWQAKAIDARLYLKTTHTVQHTNGDIRAMQEYCYGSQARMCRHKKMWPFYNKVFYNAFWPLGLPAEPGNPERQSHVDCCLDCHTDIELLPVYRLKRHAKVFEVITYRCLDSRMWYVADWNDSSSPTCLPRHSSVRDVWVETERQEHRALMKDKEMLEGQILTNGSAE